MPLGASGEGLGSLLGSSWGLLEGPRGLSERYWGPLGAVWGLTGAVLRVMLPLVDVHEKPRGNF